MKKTLNMSSGFTLLEVIFVIVIIGILAGVAIPKLAATRDDAEIAKAKSTIASVRAALSTERQLRVLRGDFTPITSLNADGAGAFTVFSLDGGVGGNPPVSRPVLGNTVPICAPGGRACWNAAAPVYTYVLPISGNQVPFSIQDANGITFSGQFRCIGNANDCRLLTQ